MGLPCYSPKQGFNSAEQGSYSPPTGDLIALRGTPKAQWSWQLRQSPHWARALIWRPRLATEWLPQSGVAETRPCARGCYVGCRSWHSPAPDGYNRSALRLSHWESGNEGRQPTCSPTSSCGSNCGKLGRACVSSADCLNWAGGSHLASGRPRHQLPIDRQIAQNYRSVEFDVSDNTTHSSIGTLWMRFDSGSLGHRAIVVSGKPRPRQY